MALGARLLRDGDAPLAIGHHQARDERHEHRRGHRERKLAARRETPGEIAPRSRARLHRPLLEVREDVLVQQLHRGIPLRGIAPHRLQDDRVEVAGDLARERLRQVETGRHRGLLLQQHHVGEGLALAHRAIGREPGEHLVQDHAEGIDVGRGGDGAGRDLLRRRVAQRHHAPAEPRELARGARDFLLVEELGDAEVQQLHAARRVDEDVVGLQVAVHHEAPVGVRDRRQHLPEEREALGNRMRARHHVIGERQALDEFHREPRLPVGADPGVVEARDVGMLELREDVALAAKALAPHFALLAQRRELERHQSLDAPVGLAREPDLAHAAVPERAQELEGPDPRADRVRARPAGARGEPRHGLELAGTLGPLVGVEHAAQDGRGFGMRRFDALEPGGARGDVHLEGRREERLDLQPEIARKFHSVWDKRIPARNRAIRIRVSRRRA